MKFVQKAKKKKEVFEFNVRNMGEEGVSWFEAVKILGWMDYNVLIAEREYRKISMIYREEFDFEYARLSCL